MRPFLYQRADELGQAIRAGVAQDQGAGVVQYMAGGTTLIDLMKLDVLRPERVVDITPLRRLFGAIESGPSGLRLGALAKMSVAAEHPAVTRDYPAIAQSLQLAASAQLRNMASLGGNVLQRTRCPYYRDPSWRACNKRSPGSGCAALTSVNRNHAVLGVDSSCIAQYPGDFAIALVALGARVEVSGPGGARAIEMEDLHRPANNQPYLETVLAPGDLITGFQIPAAPWTRRSVFLKVRDRASYEFAVASAAVALDLDGEVVRRVRVGLGGMAYRPWRAREAEALLVGKPLNEETAQAAAHAAMSEAITHGGNDYKPELGRRTLVRALMQAKAMEA